MWWGKRVKEEEVRLLNTSPFFLLHLLLLPPMEWKRSTLAITRQGLRHEERRREVQPVALRMWRPVDDVRRERGEESMALTVR